MPIKRPLLSFLFVSFLLTTSYAEAMQETVGFDGSIWNGEGIIGVSFYLDDPMRNYFQDDHPLSGIAWLGNDYLCSGEIYNALFAGMFFSGYAFDKKNISDTAVLGFGKLLLDMNVCALLKHNVDRARPDSSSNDSFTSGHTTPPASFASMVSTMSDWNPWVTGISYSISAFTGLCRMESDKHWFSDIVATHALTTLTAIPISKFWKTKNFVILPDVSDDRKAIVAFIRF